MFNQIKPFLKRHALWLFYTKQIINLTRLSLHENFSFVRAISIEGKSSRKALSTNLIYYVHQIEKGLSHSKFRAGFGIKPLRKIYEILELWDSNGYPTTDYEYQLALSSLLAYETKHKQLHSALPAHFTDLFSQRLSQILAVSSELSGAVKSASADSRQRSFYSVIEERHSTREFGAEKVDRATLLDCIKLAVCSPSVCNRQPARVMVLNNPSIIQKALDIQGGWKGFEYPQTLLLVLSDMSSFTTYVEHHEPYVDGGIFSMTLLAAFEDRKVKACPLNTMFTKMQENKIRQLLSVSDDFAFIMFIAIGTEKEGVLHPMSKRKNVETLLWEK